MRIGRRGAAQACFSRGGSVEKDLSCPDAGKLRFGLVVARAQSADTMQQAVWMYFWRFGWKVDVWQIIYIEIR